MELDEHVPVHVLEPEQPEYHAPLDDDIQVEDDDEDPSEEHEPEDDDEDPNEEHESKGSDETESFKEPFEEDETAATPPPPTWSKDICQTSDTHGCFYPGID
nr:hypothetical protein [Tanacetum cinerariifolium]